MCSTACANASVQFPSLLSDSFSVPKKLTSTHSAHPGTLVRRHRIPYTYSERESDGSVVGPWNRTFPEPHITHWDINLRQDIYIYGRKHRIVDCDAFTRNFLENQVKRTKVYIS